MTEIRHFAGWLRSLAGLAAVAGMLALSGCGGGSGAPNNVFKSTVTVQPDTAVAYSGQPMTLTLTGGTGPFRAFSSNSGVLPVTQDVAGRTVVLLPANVAADTDVTITIQDLGPLQPVAPTATAVITVRASPLGNSLTIVPTTDDCGTAVCSGQTALATVTVLGSQGNPQGRAVRFDVIGSAYSIVTNNPAQPLASTLTVLTDAAGKASVILLVNANAPTQFAQLRVTDVASGQQLVGNFTIVENTNGEAILSIVPDSVTITGAFKGQCSNGFPIDYFIYGGTPPYHVSSTFPGSVTLVNSQVNANGGSFRVITNGSCVSPLVFTIVDATGRQTTATLNNNPGTEEPPAPAPIAISPTSVSSAACTGKTFTFIVTGGTPGYSAIVNPSGTAVVTGNQVKVSGLTTGSGDTTVSVVDQSSPPMSIPATISCS